MSMPADQGSAKMRQIFDRPHSKPSLQGPGPRGQPMISSLEGGPMGRGDAVVTVGGGPEPDTTFSDDNGRKMTCASPSVPDNALTRRFANVNLAAIRVRRAITESDFETVAQLRKAGFSRIARNDRTGGGAAQWVDDLDPGARRVFPDCLRRCRRAGRDHADSGWPCLYAGIGALGSLGRFASSRASACRTVCAIECDEGTAIEQRNDCDIQIGLEMVPPRRHHQHCDCHASLVQAYIRFSCFLMNWEPRDASHTSMPRGLCT